MTNSPLIDTLWREKNTDGTGRLLRIVDRCNARETLNSPVVWQVEVVEHRDPRRIGRTTYLSDTSLTRSYTQVRHEQEPLCRCGHTPEYHDETSGCVEDRCPTFTQPQPTPTPAPDNSPVPTSLTQDATAALDQVEHFVRNATHLPHVTIESLWHAFQTLRELIHATAGTPLPQPRQSLSMRHPNGDATLSFAQRNERIFAVIEPDSPLTHGYEEAHVSLDEESLRRLSRWITTGRVVPRQNGNLR